MTECVTFWYPFVMQNTEQRDQSISVFAELKRRNVFHVALLYMVAAWLILQLIDVLFAQLGVPGWAFRLVFALLLICFPAVLAFSWVCEITPEGIKREQHIETDDSITTRTGRKINHITLVLLAFVVLLLIADQMTPGTKVEQDSTVNMEADNKALTADGAGLKTKLAAIDLQGHRGARGLMPENSIPAFLHALDLGVTTLEMDVAINADGHVVVSHEPWISAKICSHRDGREITEEEEKTLRIYAMSDVEVAGYDCGSRGHPDYPNQQAMPVSKPLLSDVFTAISARAKTTGRNARFGLVLYNIEIKSLPEGDRIFHPEVMEFAKTLYRIVKEHGLVEQTTIQSFDTRALEAMHEIDPQISISLLVENQDGLQQNLSRLSFVPQVYSPDYQLLDQDQIDAAHALDILVIPWTINDEKTMRELVGMDIDGIITDYPDLGTEVLAKIQQGQ